MKNKGKQKITFKSFCLEYLHEHLSVWVIFYINTSKYAMILKKISPKIQIKIPIAINGKYYMTYTI